MNTAPGIKPLTPELLAEFIITKPRNDNLLICTSGDYFILTGLIKVLSKLTDQPFSPSGLTLFFPTFLTSWNGTSNFLRARLLQVHLLGYGMACLHCSRHNVPGVRHHLHIWAVEAALLTSVIFSSVKNPVRQHISIEYGCRSESRYFVTCSKWQEKTMRGRTSLEMTGLFLLGLSVWRKRELV